MSSSTTTGVCIKCQINRAHGIRCKGCTCKQQYLCQVCLSRSIQYIRIACQYCESPYQVKAVYTKDFLWYNGRWIWIIPLIISVIRVHATCTLNNTIAMLDILICVCLLLPLYMFFIPVIVMVATVFVKTGYVIAVLSRSCAQDTSSDVFIPYVTNYNITILLDILIFLVTMFVRLAHVMLHVKYVLLMADGMHLDINTGIHTGHNEPV
jgi:hypothetical protein